MTPGQLPQLEEDPNLRALGVDVTAMNAEQLDQVGVVVAPVGGAEGEAWRAHADYERADLAAATTARAYVLNMAATHLREHGELRGFQMPRAFPCPGTFRVLDKIAGGKVLVLECDTCGEDLAVATVSRETVQQDIPF